MVLFLPLIAAIPTVIGVSEAVAAQRRNNDASPKDEKEQMRKFTLECYCDGKGRRAKEVHGGKVVLRDGKVWIQPLNNNRLPSASQSLLPSPSTSHPFLGFYLPYPDPSRPSPAPLGLVSFISADPPTLNWIYVDRDTREVKYGNRTQSIRHLVGPWGWDVGDGDEDGGVRDENDGGGGLTLEGAEGAVVRFRDGVEGGWEVLWDGDENGKGEGGVKGLEVSLERRWVDDGADGDDVVGKGKENEQGNEKGKVEGKFEVTTMNDTRKKKGG